MMTAALPLEPEPAAPSDAVSVAVDAPLHTGLGLLSYAPPSDGQSLQAGQIVRVPLGARSMLGVVWDAAAQPAALPAGVKLRPIEAVLPLGALDLSWRRLVAFAARYYQRSVGEMAAVALPPALRGITQQRLQGYLQPKISEKTPKGAKSLLRPTSSKADLGRGQPSEAMEGQQAHAQSAVCAQTPDTSLGQKGIGWGAMAGVQADGAPALSAEQRAALDAIASAGVQPCLLWGATGSGKTEVYLHAVQRTLQTQPTGQALVLVPEINLTPQLIARFQARFEPLLGAGCVVALHSDVPAAQRLKNWLAAHTGRARIVLGTRLAVLASVPQLAIVIVDEEHDASFKQDDGPRYHARDLAIWRAHDARVPIVLGSATPSLESWHAAEVGRYRRIDMSSRIGQAALPEVRMVDMHQTPPGQALSQALIAAIAQRVQRGEQSLLLLNRRGFAPVLMCTNKGCGYKSDCPHCSAYQVLHKRDHTLRCHHCGARARAPQVCPRCGSAHLLPVGVGTQKVEEELAERLADVRRADGGPVRIARMDADTTAQRGALAAQLAAMHAGEVDVLVGTQMVAKGHDFRRITLVAAVQPDGALFSGDFRASERLLALLMQAAGRAGRDGAFMQAAPERRAELLVQTLQPDHALYQCLRSHDWAAFAQQELEQRRAAGLPPVHFQAILRADAKTQAQAAAFLHEAAALAREQAIAHVDDVFISGPIPLLLARLADVERVHVLIDAADRRALQRFLHAWLPHLHALKARHKAVLRWLMDVDPQEM